MMFCTFVAVVMPSVMSQPMLTSSAGQVCPEGMIVFTCTTTGSSTLAWRSDEYIGSGRQLEFLSVNHIGMNRFSTSNPETVATLTAINDDGMTVTLTSMLHIVARSTTPSVSVSCRNAGGETSTLTVPLAGM